jgi:phage terminase large subunit-like protein
MDWSTACEDWGDRIVSGRSIVPVGALFPEEADAALAAFRDLRVVDAAGSPTIGESSREWIIDFASALFGSYDPVAAKRLITNYFILISKKNGKSTTAAAIMLTALLMNWRKSAEFLILAPTLEVANNSFFAARDMVKADEELAELLHVQEHLKQITHEGTGAILKVVAADNDTVSGKKATGVLVDELWLFGKRANAENMLREATGGLVSRPEGFVVYLSTQSDEPPAGVFKQKLQYFRDVRDGKIVDKRSLPVLFEFPPKMVEEKAYLDPANFYVTNPNIGLSVSREWLEAELSAAQAAGEESVRGFVAKHLNIEVGQALRSDRWAGAEYWEAAADPGLTLDELLASCDVVTIGIDGGGLDDLYGFCVIGRERGDGDVRFRRWLCWNHTWCARVAVERRKSEAAKYADFEAAGELTIVDNLDDAEVEMAGIIKRIHDAGLLAGVGMDPAGAKSLVDKLECAGVPTDLIAAVSQGYKLNGIIVDCERRLFSRTLIHGGQTLMSWAVSNARLELKGNAVIVTKQASGKAKIDPLMALFDAATLMSMNPEPTGISVFDRLAAGDVDEAVQADDIDPKILANPRHPQWQEMRERWEAQHLSSDDVW